MQNFHLDFILHVVDMSAEQVRSSLAEFGEGLEITDCQNETGKGKNYKVRVCTEDPTIIFDVCGQFGRIKSAKINESKS